MSVWHGCFSPVREGLAGALQGKNSYSMWCRRPDWKSRWLLAICVCFFYTFSLLFFSASPVWRLHLWTWRPDVAAMTIQVFQLTKYKSNSSQLALFLKNTHRRLKTHCSCDYCLALENTCFYCVLNVPCFLFKLLVLIASSSAGANTHQAASQYPFLQLLLNICWHLLHPLQFLNT